MTQDELQDHVMREMDGAEELGSVRAVSCEGGLPATEDAVTDCTVDSAALGEVAVSVFVTRDEGDELVPAMEYLTLTGLPPAP